jgi:hypothetical protein
MDILLFDQGTLLPCVARVNLNQDGCRHFDPDRARDSYFIEGTIAESGSAAAENPAEAGLHGRLQRIRLKPDSTAAAENPAEAGLHGRLQRIRLKPDSTRAETIRLRPDSTRRRESA